jgi:hypothetical protein
MWKTPFLFLFFNKRTTLWLRKSGKRLEPRQTPYAAKPVAWFAQKVHPRRNHEGVEGLSKLWKGGKNYWSKGRRSNQERDYQNSAECCQPPLTLQPMTLQLQQKLQLLLRLMLKSLLKQPRLLKQLQRTRRHQ